MVILNELEAKIIFLLWLLELVS